MSVVLALIHRRVAVGGVLTIRGKGVLTWENDGY